MNITEALKAAGWTDTAISMASEQEMQRMERFAQIIRNQALEEAKADLIDALIADCENGVKFLNEKAAEDFKRSYPHLDAAIRSMKKEQP